MRTRILKAFFSVTILIFTMGTGHAANNALCIDHFSAGLNDIHIRYSENVVDKTSPIYIHRKKSQYRKLIVKHFLNKEVTTQDERQAFVEARLQKVEPKNRLVIEFENSKLKFLNDVIKDKDLITAIDNFSNSYILHKITAWISAQHPEIVIYKFSDGKGITIILDAPKTFTGDLDQINSVFNSFQKDLSYLLKMRKLFRDSDEIEHWFRMGVGWSSDEAYFAARVSRKIKGPNKVIHFSNPTIQKNLTDSLYSAEQLRQKIADSKDLASLLTVEPNTGKTVPSLGLFEILRKSRNVEEITTGIFDRFQIPVDVTTAGHLLHYAEIIDLLNPKFFVVDQTVVTLANAVNGGIVVDRKGMGSVNQLATAFAAAQVSHLIIDTQLTRARTSFVSNRFVQLNREEEFKVTAVINTYRQRMEIEFGAKCRGDDCVIEDLSKINISQFLNSDLIKGQRVVFVPPGIESPESRSEMSTHGESIEKLFIKRLYKYLKPTTIQSLTFAIDFKTTQLDTGQVNILINPLNQLAVNAGLETLIQTTLKQAIEDFNTEQTILGKDSNYEAGQSITIAPEN